MKENSFPVIRFEGFAGDWTAYKIRELANVIGGGTPSTKEKVYWNGDINWFTPSEITGDKRFVFNSNRKITNLGLNNSSAKLLPKDKTILFTSRASVGDMVILKEDATTNQGFQCIRVL